MQGKECIFTLLLSAVLVANVFASDDRYYDRFLEVTKTQKGFMSDVSLVETNNLGPNLINGPFSFSRFAENGELASIRLGMNMSQVVATWGKPSRLITFCGLGPRFWYPSKSFGSIALAFKEDKLAIIALDLAQLKGVGFDNGLNSKATDLECERILGTPTLRYPNTEGWFFGGAIAYRTNGFRTDLNFRSIAAPKPVGSKKVLSMISVASRDAQVPVQTVTFAKLLNNPERYDYLRVKVEGYLKSHGDLAALYENKVQADVPRKDYVWIAPTVTVDHEKDVQSIKEGKVRVIGVVDCGLRSLEFGVGRSNHWDISISELELLEEVKE